MARTITTATITPPVRQGETAVIDFTNPDGTSPVSWDLAVVVSTVETGPPLTLVDTTVTSVGDADKTIRVTFGAIDTAALTAGTVYGELWRNNSGSETLLRAFSFTVADPIRVPVTTPTAALTIGDEVLTIGDEILTIGA
jgi:hypothetical protein